MDYTRMEEDLIRDEGLRLRTYRCTAWHGQSSGAAVSCPKNGKDGNT